MSDRSDAADRPADEADETPSITPDALADRLRSGDELTVLDVRDRDEFERWHLEGEGVTAVHIPHMKFIQAEVTGGANDLVADLAEPILAVCGHGEASAHAVSLLRDAGIDARNLAGGMDAWADLYVARELETEAPATVVQYDRPSSGCLAYAIYSDGEAAVIDPLRAFADRYVDAADDRNATIEYAIDTHVHADHVSGVRALTERTDAEAVVPKGATDRGLAFDATTIGDAAEHSSASPASHARQDGDELRVGNATLTAVATPGHTTESLSYRLDDLLFTGDTLFLEGSAGRTSSAGTTARPLPLDDCTSPSSSVSRSFPTRRRSRRATTATPPSRGLTGRIPRDSRPYQTASRRSRWTKPSSSPTRRTISRRGHRITSGSWR